MLQFLKKYRFWALMLLPALIMFADLLLGLEAHPLIDGLGFTLFLLACMSVPTNFKKKKSNRRYLFKLTLLGYTS